MFTKLPISTALCALAAQCMLSPISHAQTASLSLSNSAYIRVPTSPDFALQQFSLSVWFKPTASLALALRKSLSKNPWSQPVSQVRFHLP